MQFTGAIYRETTLLIADVVGVLRDHSGKFVLQAGEALDSGDYLLQTEDGQRLNIKVLAPIGSSDLPRVYEFFVER